MTLGPRKKSCRVMNYDWRNGGRFLYSWISTWGFPLISHFTDLIQLQVA